METIDPAVNMGNYKAKTKNGTLKIKKIKYPDFKGDEPCTQVGTDVFYPEFDDHTKLEEINYIRQFICGKCPMINECLEYALYHEMYGIWGGTTERMRKTFRKQLSIICTEPKYTDDYLVIQDRFERSNSAV
jgi:hypothetical protein